MNLLSAPQRIGSPRGSTAEANRGEADFAELFGSHEPAECSAKGTREVRRPKQRRREKKKKKGYDEIEECSEDEEARYRNANPRSLPSSPRRGTMMEELELLVLGMKTRNTEKSEGESVPFIKKELNEPLFYEHTFQAEIHNNPLEETDKTDYTENLFNNSTENNIQQNSTLESEISNYEDAESYDELNSQNHNNSNSRIEIPPKLLQILDNLTGNNSKINQGEVQENLMPESENEEKNCPKNQIFIDDYIEEKDIEEDNEEKFDEDEDNDSEDIDELLQ
ncbi:glutamic acid-rich protein-like [Pogonomyrmex barbatus]|uniref:Glutamic acid-rich protein-like n=1 Tax=Pogonomyrmex barbatus TaxID=144034 RepID=A0A6I9VRM9_9HYME|nr:glutamic acid-rich protein-like [Pogonomyrmex barbatus]